MATAAHSPPRASYALVFSLRKRKKQEEQRQAASTAAARAYSGAALP